MVHKGKCIADSQVASAFLLVQVRLRQKYYASHVRPNWGFEPMASRSRTVHFTSLRRCYLNHSAIRDLRIMNNTSLRRRCPNYS